MRDALYLVAVAFVCFVGFGYVLGAWDRAFHGRQPAERAHPCNCGCHHPGPCEEWQSRRPLSGSSQPNRIEWRR